MKKLTQLLNDYLITPNFGGTALAASIGHQTPADWAGKQIAGISPDSSLKLNFRGAPLWQILNYLGTAAGFIINAKANVEVGDAMDVWSDKPLEKEEALNLVRRVLSEKGYTAIRDGRRVTIIRTQDTKKSYIPLRHVCGTASASAS